MNPSLIAGANVIPEKSDIMNAKSRQTLQEKLALERTGTVSYNRQGLKMTVVKYNQYTDMIVRFDADGSEKHCAWREFINGKVQHPRGINFVHVGETNTNNDGIKMKIVDCLIGNGEVTVRFEDGSEMNTTYNKFLKGCVKIPYDKNRHVGETNTNPDGLKMTIIKYDGCHDVVVQFDDKTKKKCTYRQFCKGDVNNEKYRHKQYEGETNTNRQGLNMTIAKYYRYDRVLVRFDDGSERECRYPAFRSGKVPHPDEKTKHLGETNTNSQGFKMTIVRYENSCHMTVKFEDGLEKNTSYGEFLKGSVAHPTRKIGTIEFNKRIYVWSGVKYLKCKCNRCGYEDYLTADEVMHQIHQCE